MSDTAAAPTITHGPISGEVSDSSVVLWARGNQSGQLTFEVVADGLSASPICASAVVDAEGDFTGKVCVDGLGPGQAYNYRVALMVDGEVSRPRSGYFKTAPSPDRPDGFQFVFGSCIGGQGYCRLPDIGYPIFEPMLARRPDFMLLIGDSIYADTECPSPPNIPCPVHIARDLAGFRAKYRYNLEDSLYADFLSHTPVMITWDDHEIVDNFGGPTLAASEPQRLADGRQAFFEYWPLVGEPGNPHRIHRSFRWGALAEFFVLDTRSYRAPHVSQENAPSIHQSESMLGKEQFAWLQAGLGQSNALWKLVVSSVPLSYPTGWPPLFPGGYDSWAGTTGMEGYEPELAALLRSIHGRGIQNVVFLAGDTHWPYAISYDPDCDGEADFYELGSSPLSALPLTPVEKPDGTFNPTVLYAEGTYAGDLLNFGHITVTEDGLLTFKVVDWKGIERYTLSLRPVS